MTQGHSLEIRTAKIFEPLLVPSRYKAAHGGRGSGKSWFMAGLLVERCVRHPGTRAVCVREVQKTLRESVKLLVEDMLKAMGVESLFRPLSDSIITPGGGIILFQGMADHTAQSIKSLAEFDIAYVEEAQTMTAASLEMLRPTIRKTYKDGTHAEIWFSWNPRHASDPVDKFFRGPELPPDAVVVEVNYMDNPFFPEVLKMERAFDEKHSRDRYGHVWLGHYEPTALGAIWNRLNLHQGRRKMEEIPTLKRILVSVDHAVTSGPDADDHGIIVGGLGEDNRGYILEDASTRGTPQQWATRAVAMFDKWEADAIVIEVNQGGDLVRECLQSVRRTIPIVEVRATRGKHVRAEPIASLYAMDRVSHVGAFPLLEDQLCLITPAGYEGKGSPDRADALVWLLTKLFPSIITKPTKDRGQGRRPLAGPNAWMGA